MEMPAFATDAPRAPGHPLLRLGLLPLLVIAVLAFLLPLLSVGRLLARLPQRDLIIVLSLLTYGAILAWLAVSMPRAGVSWRRVLGRGVPARRLWEIPVVAWMHVSFAANSLVLLLVALLHLFPDFTRRMLEARFLVDPWSGAAPLPLALVIVVLAPVVEELLFRGVLLQRFALRWGPRRAVLVTSAIFALLHPYHPIALFLFSVLLSVLFLATRSLWAPIGAHAVANGTLVLIGSLAPRDRPPTPDIGQLMNAVRIAIPALAFVGLVVGIYLWRRWPPRDQPIPYDDP